MATVQRFRGDVEFYGNTANNLSLVPLTFYAAPSAQGTGDGLSAGNAATLQTILTNKVKIATYVVVKLASGNHVLSSTVTIDGQLYLQLEAENYDNQNPPIICTTHSTGAYISEDTSGDPSSSQTCTAHGYDEYPLLIKNSHVSFKNVWFHGTRYCLNIVNSFVELHGDTFFKLWAYNISSTQHDGMAIYAEKSRITGENATKFWMYHPQYQSTSDTFVKAVTPLFLTSGTEMMHTGTVTWVANTQTNLDHKLISCLYVYDSSTASFSDFIIDGVLNAFYTTVNSRLFVSRLIQQGTAKLAVLSRSAQGSDVYIVTGSNISACPTTANLAFIVVSAARFYADVLFPITIYGTAGVLLYCIQASFVKFFAPAVLAEDRASNLGCQTMIYADNMSTCLWVGNATTRNTGDKFVIAVNGSIVKNASGTITASAPYYTVTYGGRFIEVDGTVRS